jgi:hypothetical protein
VPADPIPTAERDIDSAAMPRAASRPTTRLGAALVLAGTLLAVLLLAGCESNPESDLSVEEGQPVKLGDLVYNVQISRPLNPADPEDEAYLVGQPPPPNDKLYLGVFLQIENQGDGAQEVPEDFVVTDTEGQEFEPIPSRSLFALELGGTVAGNRELPNPESTAANGPIQGAMILFLIPEAATEARPLTLDIPSPDGAVAEVELDL